MRWTFKFCYRRNISKRLYSLKQEHSLNLPHLFCHSVCEHCLTKAICMAVAGVTHVCSFCPETSFRNRRMRNRANSQQSNVMYSTFTDLPMKDFYVITVNFFDDHEISVNCLEMKRKQICVNYFVHNDGLFFFSNGCTVQVEPWPYSGSI
jgi:hypothetical protein